MKIFLVKMDHENSILPSFGFITFKDKLLLATTTPRNRRPTILLQGISSDCRNKICQGINSAVQKVSIILKWSSICGFLLLKCHTHVLIKRLRPRANVNFLPSLLLFFCIFYFVANPKMIKIINYENY